MKAGFDVLIEKPMALKVKAAERIIECQKKTGANAGVIHNWLFDSPILEATSAVKKGYIGEVMNVEVEAISTKYDSMAADRHHWCHSLRGGRFSEMLAHPIYLIRHFLGEPELGEIQVSKIGEYEWMKSDELCATFKIGEKLGRAYASFNAPRKAIFISLYGTEAILKLDIINATTIIYPRRETRRLSKGFDSLRQATQLIKSTVKNITKIAFGRWLSGHEMCIKLFAQGLVDGSGPPVTVGEGCRVVKTLEEMCERIEKLEKKSQQKSTENLE
jgi:predicted dehydrogenase